MDKIDRDHTLCRKKRVEIKYHFILKKLKGGFKGDEKYRYE